MSDRIVRKDYPIANTTLTRFTLPLDMSTMTAGTVVKSVLTSWDVDQHVFKVVFRCVSPILTSGTAFMKVNDI